MTQAPLPPTYQQFRAPMQAPPQSSKFWLGFGAGAAAVLALLIVVGICAAMIAGIGAFGSARANVASMRAQAAAQRALAGANALGDGTALSVEELAIQTALDEGDLERAAELAAEYAPRAPDTANAKAVLAAVAIEQSLAAADSANADRLMHEALEAGVLVQEDQQLGVAELWLSDGEAERCRAIADRVYSQVKGDDPDAQYTRGLALLIRGLARGELGDPTGGAADLKKAISIAPSPEIAEEWQNYLDQMQQQAQ